MLKVNDLQRHHAPLRAVLARAMEDVLGSGWYILGRYGEAFERAFADFCGARHAVGVASGTDALELALRAVGVGPGDEVVTVANAGMYATTATLCVGATPVFVDVDTVDMTLDVGGLERAIGPRCKAVVLTHLYGWLADVDSVLELATARGVPVVEDCAHAPGAALGQRRAGSFGKLGCFSFYPTKNLGACGDGGMVTTSDEGLARRLRQLRQYGWSEKFHVAIPGGKNTRLDELQAAILLEKLPYLPDWNARRVAIAERYTGEIRNPLVKTPRIERGRHVVHLYVVRCAERDSLRKHLRRDGFAAEIHYPVPDHRQPAFADRFRDVNLPVSERVAREVLTLPCFPEMTDEEVGSVIASCNAFALARSATSSAGAAVEPPAPVDALSSGDAAPIPGNVHAHRAGSPDGSQLAPTPSRSASVDSTRVAGVTVHRLPFIEDMRGNLTVGEFERTVPFPVKRFFMVIDVPSAEVRGEHAHHRCHQFLVCARGSVSLIVDDGSNRQEITLDAPNIGVHLPPLIWGEQYGCTKDAVLLVFCSEYYDAADYIRNYAEFLTAIGKA